MIRSRKDRGFSLIEMVITITVISIMAAVAYPIITGMGDAAKLSEAETKARSVELRMQAYAERVPDANANWQAVNNHQRLNLIGLGGADIYVEGYTITLPANITGSVTVTPTQ